MEDFYPDIERAIKKKYKNLENPEYFFLSNEEEKENYDGLLDFFRAQGFVVFDDTDFNVDVSLHCRLCKTEETYILRLSFIGRFAVLAKIDADQILLIDGAETSDRLAFEILEVLKKFGVRCLSEEVISRSYPISLIDLEEGDATIFNALFSTDNYRGQVE